MSKIQRPVFHIYVETRTDEELQEIYERVRFWWNEHFEYPEYGEEYYHSMCNDYGVQAVNRMIEKVKEELENE